MSMINWGIIGCGDVTEIKSGPAFNKVPGSKLVAVMRRNADKAKDYASRHQVPKWYADANSLIEDPDVNAIYVATPPSSHEEYAIASMKAGKPVYVEKPMSTDAPSAKRISDAAKRSGIKMSIAHYRRQLPIFKKVKELIDNNAIGKIKFVTLELYQHVLLKGFEPRPDNWRLDPVISGGGFFHDLSPHQLDLLYYFFGHPLYSKGVSLNQGGFYKTDDIVAGSVLFEKDIVVNGIWSFTVPESEAKDSIRIIGAEGSISFSAFKMEKVIVNKNGKIEELRFDPVPHVQQPMIEKVVAYFSGLGENPCTGDDGVTVMQMIDSFTKKNGHP